MLNHLSHPVVWSGLNLTTTSFILPLTIIQMCKYGHLSHDCSSTLVWLFKIICPLCAYWACFATGSTERHPFSNMYAHLRDLIMDTPLLNESRRKAKQPTGFQPMTSWSGGVDSTVVLKPLLNVVIRKFFFKLKSSTWLTVWCKRKLNKHSNSVAWLRII